MPRGGERGAGSEGSTPLPLPEDFDPQACLLAKVTENGTFHESRRGAHLAASLVANGTAEDLALAGRVLEAVLRCQETRADDPHYGNFLWMAEDEVVEDLNAVQFNLHALIPLMLCHGDRLAAEMQGRVLEAIRLGLHEIQRLDVLVAYSNITVLDVVNSCLGGELLGDEQVAARGYRKLVEWMVFTDQSGTPFEYNSPTYTSVVIRALKLLVDLVAHDETRIRAQTAAARLGLSAALHIHPTTGRWAGPHSRAYHPTVVCETPPERDLVRGWVEDGTLPAWIADVLDHPVPIQVEETAFAERTLGITTYHARSFSLGVSASSFGGQANVLIAHYMRPGADRPGVLYSRYLTNDKWLGDFYHATDRTRSRNLIEEGRFYGVQQGPRAIGLYAPGQLGLVSSAKAAFILNGAHGARVWLGDRVVREYPAALADGQVAVIEDGDVLIALRPLSRTDLGREAPIRIARRGEDLVLEIHNYLGPEKRFWEMNWPGAFYQGVPQCGVYLELAERGAYRDAAQFGALVASGQLRDEAAEPFVYAGQDKRPWTVAYTRDGQTLGIEVDLMAWRLLSRWDQDGSLGWPMLESPIARETRDGSVTVGDAQLTCGPGAGWLWACPEKERWVAGYHGPSVAPLALSVPGGRVDVPAMGTGLVVWDHGTVTVDAVGLQAPPVVCGGALGAQN